MMVMLAVLSLVLVTIHCKHTKNPLNSVDGMQAKEVIRFSGSIYSMKERRGLFRKLTSV